MVYKDCILNCSCDERIEVRRVLLFAVAARSLVLGTRASVRLKYARSPKSRRKMQSDLAVGKHVCGDDGCCGCRVM